jgi:phage tail-like protein
MARALSTDPYKNFFFKVSFDASGSSPVAGINKVSGISKKADPIKYRQGGDPLSDSLAPGLTTYDPITLEQGMTQSAVFNAWANLTAPNNPALPGYDPNPRKDITIDLYNEVGDKVISYTISNCWVSHYQAIPDLDATANAIAIQTLTLQHEGWTATSGLIATG